MQTTYKILFFLLVGFMVLGCGDKHEFLSSVPFAQGTKIKFIHAASDAPAINVLVNNQQVNGAALSYSGIFPVTDYVSIDTAGINNTALVQVLIPPTATAPQTQVLSATLSVTRSQYTTVAIVGINPNYEAVVIDDRISFLPNDGKIRLRFFNFIQNSTAVDIVATPSGGTATTLYTGIAYKLGDANFSTIDLGANVSSLSYTIQLRDTATGALLATLSAANSALTGNKVYTLIARGQIGKTVVLDRVVNR
ncbi:MAG: DUF4397 domain-containing protein [Verrucomicrobia bacterium]|nr:DUF4397 domain-containing protein [Cytophagales bacterium]